MSEPFDRFVKSVRASIMTPEQYEDFALDALLEVRDPQERQQIEGLLLEELQKNPEDPRAARALSHIDSKRAIEPLWQIVNGSSFKSQYGRVGAAEALWRLTGAPRALDVIITVARRSATWEERRDAARALQHVQAPQAEQALRSMLLEDPDHLVRQQAYVSLLAMHGIVPPFFWFTGRLGVMWSVADSPIRAVRQLILDDLDEIVRRLRAGETQESLGLGESVDMQAPNVSRFFKSSSGDGIDGAGDIDYASFSHLEGFERQWAEMGLLYWVAEHPKLAKALAHIGCKRAIGPLLELLMTVKGEDAIEVAVALARLGEVVQSLAVLLALLQTADEPLRVRAAAALGEIGNRDAQAGLLGALEASPPVRRAAGEALLRIRGIDVEAHRPLLERLGGADAADRAAATLEIKSIRN